MRRTFLIYKYPSAFKCQKVEKNYYYIDLKLINQNKIGSFLWYNTYVKIYFCLNFFKQNKREGNIYTRQTFSEVSVNTRKIYE